jgi:hypothetical protein
MGSKVKLDSVLRVLEAKPVVSDWNATRGFLPSDSCLRPLWIDVTNQVRLRESFWEPNVFWASHKISCSLCNPTVLNGFQKSPPVVHILRQIKPIFDLTTPSVRAPPDLCVFCSTFCQKLKLTWVILKDFGRTAQKTLSVAISKTNQLILWNQIMTVCSQDRKNKQMLSSGFETVGTWSNQQAGRLRWSSVSHAGLWFPSSRVQTRPKPLDFSVYKILSMPSFGGEVK